MLINTCAWSQAVVVEPSTLPNGSAGTTYNQTIIANDSDGDDVPTSTDADDTFTYAVTAGALPPGLTLGGGPATAAGVPLSGTPTTAGSYTFTITATMGGAPGNSGSTTYAALVIYVGVNPASLPNGKQGVAYSQTVTASGGVGSYTYAVVSGALPAGLSLNPGTGAISGTPTNGNTSFSFTIRATDSLGNTGTSPLYTINIAATALAVGPGSLPNGMTGVAYSQTVSASGGSGSYAFAVSSGALPTGLSLNTGTGVISGTPTVSGLYNFTIQATDSYGSTGSQAYTVGIGTVSSITVSPASLPNGKQGVAYSQTVTASGGVGSYTYAVVSGALPAGLSLNPGTGAISGTPTNGNTSYSFTIRATDSLSSTGSQSYTVNIAATSLAVAPGNLPNGVKGVTYIQTVSANGGIGPYTLAVSSGTLPTGLSFNPSTGIISGTPSANGLYNFTIQATDSYGSTGSQAYTVSVGAVSSLTVLPGSLPNGMTGVAYIQIVSANGGTGPYTFAVSSGTLPTGLSFNPSTGIISGTPSANGLYNFTIRATDSYGSTGSQAYTVSVGTASSLTVSPGSLLNGVKGLGYIQTVSASGGTGPYTFAVSSGTLPTGLSFAVTNTVTTDNAGAGIISGIPTANGQYNFSIQAIDSYGSTGSRSYTVSIGVVSSLTISPTSLPNGTKTIAYSQTVSVSGGTGPYTFSVSSGSLPQGLTLDANTGLIRGTPTTNGSYDFTIQATDNIGNTGSQAFPIKIGTVSLTINPSSLPNGAKNVAYIQTVSASGGMAPYTLTLVGTLPPGLAFNAGTGVISGTPTAIGSYSFTIQATDYAGNFGSQAFPVNIGAASLTINPARLPAAIAGRPYNQTVVASGGTGPYTYSVITGTLTPGLGLNAGTGVINGTPTASGAYNFTIQALDTVGNIGTRAYTQVSRIDPKLDPEVQGLIATQMATTQRFATTQIENVTHHLEGLHDYFNPCSFNFGIAPPNDPMPPYGSPYGYPYGSSNSTPPAAREALGKRVAWRAPGSETCAVDWASSLAFWVSGAIQLGTQRPSGASSSNRFTTSGITGGVDWRAGNNLIVGVGIGYGGDTSDIGTNGTRSVASSYNGVVYASFKPFDPFFLDATAGYGSVGFDSRRFVTGDTTLANGTRNGTYWFGSLAASYELRRDNLKLAPYIRGDFISVSLQGYSEQGGSSQLLTYDRLNFSSTSAAIGLRGSIDISQDWGVLTPTARIEYRQTVEGAYDQSLYYSDFGPGLSSVISQQSNTRGVTTGAVGLRARMSGGPTVELDYSMSEGSRSFMARTLRARLHVPF